tara:strand:+ start:323 stop:1036 length:714 start_codon:yes stop_codon:yes gene_type:complete
MAVNVNTVYQRVLALANKEQRGYITPQEFNLLANQAQLQIFDQYFYDVDVSGRMTGNSTEYSDRLDMLEEKLAPFEKFKQTIAMAGNEGTLPSDLYRLGTVYFAGGGGAYDIEVEQINKKEFTYIERSPLAEPTVDYPVYFIKGVDKIKTFPSASITANVTCDYIKKPAQVSWDYIVLNDKALYKSDTSVNFELHPSEEHRLVDAILGLAGIILNKPGLVNLAGTREAATINQQKQI